MSERNILILFAFVAFLGIINAGYLSFISLSGGVPSCNFLAGCDIVAKSTYSKVFGIPLSLFGVFFYFTAGALAVLALFERTKRLLQVIFLLTAFGFILSLYFLYLQAFVINAYCEYCLFSLFDSVILFLLALYLMRKFKKYNQEEKI